MGINDFVSKPNAAGTRFLLSMPAQAVGASLVYFDVWTATVPMILDMLEAINDGSVAVTGLVGVKLIATRTSTIGTGGTAAVIEGATVTVPALSSSYPSVVVPTDLTARITPSGGGTAGAILGEGQIFAEETNTANYGAALALIRAPIYIPAATGFRVIQGSVASVGNIGFRATMYPAL